MKKIIVGLLALLLVAIAIGMVVHWFVGALVVVIPIAVTYIRIKMSPGYSSQCDAKVNRASLEARPK